MLYQDSEKANKSQNDRTQVGSNDYLGSARKRVRKRGGRFWGNSYGNSEKLAMETKVPLPGRHVAGKGEMHVHTHPVKGASVSTRRGP